MTKRLIIIIVAVSAILMIGLWLLSFMKVDEDTVGADNKPITLPLSDSKGFLGNRNNLPVIIGGGEEMSKNKSSVLDRARQLTKSPVSGSIIISKQVDVIQERVKVKELIHNVRYVDRATGHIYELRSTALEPTLISNKTLPKIYEASFVSDGSKVIMRSLDVNDPDSITTYSLAMKEPKTSATSTTPIERSAERIELKEVSGEYLASDIKEVAISPSGLKILSLMYSDGGGRLDISNIDGKNAKTITTHPLREWLLSLPSDARAVITTKPSGGVNGFAYILNLDSGELRKIVGGVAGLTILPRNDLVVYLGAGTPSGSIKLFAYFDKTRELKVLPLQTLPEKCVWAKAEADIAYCAVPIGIIPATYPDDWYKGRVSFTDNIWKVDVKTGKTDLVASLPEETGQAIDAINLQISTDDKYLTFTNKIDLTLWGLDISHN